MRASQLLQNVFQNACLPRRPRLLYQNRNRANPRRQNRPPTRGPNKPFPKPPTFARHMPNCIASTATTFLLVSAANMNYVGTMIAPTPVYVGFGCASTRRSTHPRRLTARQERRRKRIMHRVRLSLCPRANSANNARRTTCTTTPQHTYDEHTSVHGNVVGVQKARK